MRDLSPQEAANPASAGGPLSAGPEHDGRSGTLLSLPGSAASTSESYSTTYVVERSFLPPRRGFWDVLGFQKKRGVARPLLFPSPPGTPSPFSLSSTSGSWKHRVRKFVWSEEMRYMLVALCLFCVLVQVALMYRWAQSDARGDRPASSRGAEFLDSSTAFDDAPFPADAPGPWGTKGQPTVPKKAPRSAASVLSKFRDSRLQQGMPTSVEEMLVGALSAHSARVLLPSVRSRADTNHDGHVSQQELSRFVARHGQDRIALAVERAMSAALDATWGPLADDLPPTRNSRSCELRFSPDDKSHLEVSLSDGLQFADTKPFCIEAWVKPSAPVEREDGPDYYGGVILSKYNGGVQGQVRLEVLRDGSLKLHREVAPYGLQADTRIPAGVYTHVAASYGFGWAALYVNGTMAAMQREGGVPDDSVTPVLVGATLEKGEPSGFFSGAIADMRIWSMSCQQVDMKAHMNHTLSGWEHGLQAYWKFDECLGGRVHDRAGVHDGVVRGGAKWAHAGVALAAGDEEVQCRKWAKEQLGIS